MIGIMMAVMAMVFAVVVGWDFTSPDGKIRCHVENSPKDRHRKDHLETHGWKGVAVKDGKQAAKSPPPAQAKTPPVDVKVTQGKDAPAPTKPKSDTPPEEPPFEVIGEKADDGTVSIKLFSIVPEEEVYMSKANKAQLVTLAAMAGVEHEPDATVEKLKELLTSWAAAHMEKVRFLGAPAP